MAPAMKNGRCRLHGGKSTGPLTKAGKERIAQAHLRHGRLTKEAISSRNEFKAFLKALKKNLGQYLGES